MEACILICVPSVLQYLAKNSTTKIFIYNKYEKWMLEFGILCAVVPLQQVCLYKSVLDCEAEFFYVA